MLRLKICFESKLFERRFRDRTTSATLFQIYIFILARSENNEKLYRLDLKPSLSLSIHSTKDWKDYDEKAYKTCLNWCKKLFYDGVAINDVGIKHYRYLMYSYESVSLHLLKRTFSLLTKWRTVISLIAHA